MWYEARTILIAAVVALAPLAAGAAGIPDPNLSQVPNVVVAPDGSLQYRVVLYSSQGALDSALVQLVFSSETEALLCWCSGQVHPVVSSISNILGQAEFYIAAGGCVDSGLVASPPAVQVYANGYPVGEVGVVSPDVVDDTGTRPQSGWNPGGQCHVTLSDAVYHSGPIQTFVYDFCSDLNSDGVVNISDAVTLTAPIVNASDCTQGP